MENRPEANFGTNEPEKNRTSHDQTKCQVHHIASAVPAGTLTCGEDYIQQYRRCQDICTGKSCIVPQDQCGILPGSRALLMNSASALIQVMVKVTTSDHGPDPTLLG